jgi:hypothetical protein
MSAATEVGDILEAYARRGVFRGFSRDQGRGGKGLFRLLWHRDQVFQLAFDNRRQRLRIACVIPAVPAASPMYQDLKAWLKGRQDAALPDHRRCDPDKVSLRTYNRGGSVALTLTVLDDDLAYAVRKLVSLVNELYLDFLSDGLYYDWLVETFGLDPDRPY